MPPWEFLGPFLSAKQPRDFLLLANTYGHLIPAVRIDYLRHRFRTLGFRVNLDQKIQVRSSGHCNVLDAQDHFPFSVLEIKTKSERPRLPFLGFLQLAPISFSKFGKGLGLLSRSPETLNKYL